MVPKKKQRSQGCAGDLNYIQGNYGGHAIFQGSKVFKLNSLPQKKVEPRKLPSQELKSLNLALQIKEEEEMELKGHSQFVPFAEQSEDASETQARRIDAQISIQKWKINDLEFTKEKHKNIIVSQIDILKQFYEIKNKELKQEKKDAQSNYKQRVNKLKNELQQEKNRQEAAKESLKRNKEILQQAIKQQKIAEQRRWELQQRRQELQQEARKQQKIAEQRRQELQQEARKQQKIAEQRRQELQQEARKQQKIVEQRRRELQQRRQELQQEARKQQKIAEQRRWEFLSILFEHKKGLVILKNKLQSLCQKKDDENKCDAELRELEIEKTKKQMEILRKMIGEKERDLEDLEQAKRSQDAKQQMEILRKKIGEKERDLEDLEQAKRSYKMPKCMKEQVRENEGLFDRDIILNKIINDLKKNENDLFENNQRIQRFAQQQREAQKLIDGNKETLKKINSSQNRKMLEIEQKSHQLNEELKLITERIKNDELLKATKQQLSQKNELLFKIKFQLIELKKLKDINENLAKSGQVMDKIEEKLKANDQKLNKIQNLCWTDPYFMKRIFQSQLLRLLKFR